MVKCCRQQWLNVANEIELVIQDFKYVMFSCCCSVSIKCVVYKNVHNCSADILGPIIEGNHSCCKKIADSKALF